MPLTLGTLIELLSRVENQDAEIEFDFNDHVPVKFDSYRGDYSHLAVSSKHRDDCDERPSVATFLKACRECDGKMFVGWKGGDYYMSDRTPVWVSERGNCSRTAVHGILNEGHVVIIETRYEDCL